MFGMDLSTSRLSCMQLRATPHLVTAPSFSLSAPTTPVKSSTNYLVSTSAGKCRQSVIVAVNDVTEHYARRSFTNEQPANSRALADFLCPPFACARRKRSLKQAWMAIRRFGKLRAWGSSVSLCRLTQSKTCRSTSPLLVGSCIWSSLQRASLHVTASSHQPW